MVDEFSAPRVELGELITQRRGAGGDPITETLGRIGEIRPWVHGTELLVLQMVFTAELRECPFLSATGRALAVFGNKSNLARKRAVELFGSRLSWARPVGFWQGCAAVAFRASRLESATPLQAVARPRRDSRGKMSNPVRLESPSPFEKQIPSLGKKTSNKP